MAQAVAGVFDFLIMIVIINAVLSFFLAPYHPLRQALDRIVEPMLSPIRRVIPPAGMFDFSPLVLIILLRVLGNLVTSLLS